MAPNLTEQFLGDPATWDVVGLQLWSVQPLWGGHIISMAGPETAIVRRIGPGARHEQRFEVALDPGERTAMLRLLIAHDLPAIEPADRTSLVPDETETIVTLRKGRYTFTLSTWANDPADARVIAIIEALRGPERRTRNLKPVYDGSYEHGDAGL